MVPGAGSGLHCRGTAPTSHTCNATAMHLGTTHLSRPPHPPPAMAAASKEGPATALTPPLFGPGWGDLGLNSGNHSPRHPSQPESIAGWAPVLCCQTNPSLLQSVGGWPGNGKAATLQTARPLAPPLTLSMEMPAGVVARLSCRYPLAFSQVARQAVPDSAFPRPSRARAALKECRAALGKGLLLGPGQKSDGQTKPQALTELPLPWFRLHVKERVGNPNYAE